MKLAAESSVSGVNGWNKSYLPWIIWHVESFSVGPLYGFRPLPLLPFMHDSVLEVEALQTRSIYGWHRIGAAPALLRT